MNRDHGQRGEKNTNDNDHAPCAEYSGECGRAEDEESSADALHRDGASRDDRRIPVEGDSRAGVGAKPMGECTLRRRFSTLC